MRLFILAACTLLVAVACADAFDYGYFKNKFGSFKDKFQHGSFKNKFSSWKSWKNKFGKPNNLGGIFHKIISHVKGIFAKETENKPIIRPFGRPDFCGDYECPPFTVENKTDMYELRCYSSANWVSTKDFGYPKPMGSTSRNMFMKLFRYIGGANSEKAKIKMTVPVLVGMKGDGKQKQLRMSFYLPEKFQKNPPAPTDPSVMVKSSKFCAYVHSFKGYTLFYSQIKRQVDMLKKRLEQDGLEGSYYDDAFITAGYNKPTKVINRHNEVMLMKK